jgi:hypothetical protein
MVAFPAKWVGQRALWWRCTSAFEDGDFSSNYTRAECVSSQDLPGYISLLPLAPRCRPESWAESRDWRSHYWLRINPAFLHDLPHPLHLWYLTSFINTLPNNTNSSKVHQDSTRLLLSYQHLNKQTNFFVSRSNIVRYRPGYFIQQLTRLNSIRKENGIYWASH